MKKIIVSLFALAFLFVGQSVFATSIWNNGSQGPECPDINIASGNNGWGSPCWNGTNITVQPGSTVSVKVYYHNASGNPGITATNTRIKVIPSNGSSTNHSFTGQILSPQGNLYTNAVTANVSPAQTLTYSSTTWYVQNSSGTLVQTPLLNGQSGSEVIGSNGLYIGNVIPGWAFGQGAVVVNFTVGNYTPPPQECSINSFTANPNSVTAGGTSTLNWNTTNCTSGSINQGVGNVTGFPNGSKTVYNINNTKTYTLTAYGANNSSDTMSVTVNVNQPEECSINSFTANPNSVTAGGNSTLSWDTDNCTSGSINQGVGNVTGFPNGAKTIYNLNNTKTYTLTAYGQSGNSDTMNVTVNVEDAQSDCSISYFNANPSSIEEGDSSTLSWDTNGNCSSASINKGIGNVSASGGYETVEPIDTTTYTLTVYSNNGYSDSDTVTVYVDEAQNDCSISYFRASPSSIDQGDSSKLSWDTNGDCNSASINKGIGNVNSSNGNETVYPDDTTTYTLTVYGDNGYSDSDTVTVYVDDEEDDNCSISYFRANPTSVSYGSSSTLSWNTNECTSVSISNIGSVNDDGSQTVYPTYTTTYTIYAYGSSGRSVTKTAQVYVNNYVPPPTPIYNTCAVTTVATNIGQNSATLNGLVTNSNSYGANTYFEYGKTVALGSQTNARTVSGSTSFSENLTGLSSNTIYFYRLVSNCGNGIGRGSIEIFQTQGVQTQVVTRTIVRQGTTVIGTESPIMLKIENRYQSFRVGDTVDYTVTYKNIGSKRLTDPVLQVILPKGVAFLNSSQGTYSSDTYTLTVSLNDLNPGDEGVVYLQGRVDSIDTGNAQIVTTAILVYTSPNGAQENAIAYVLNNPIFNSSLGALALFGNLFGFGIIGWLLILILILLAILLFRKVYRERRIG